MLQRLFHAAVDIDTIRPHVAQEPRSAEAHSANYAPMTLPTVTYDAFLKTVTVPSSMSLDAADERRHIDADAMTLAVATKGPRRNGSSPPELQRRRVPLEPHATMKHVTSSRSVTASTTRTLLVPRKEMSHLQPVLGRHSTSEELDRSRSPQTARHQPVRRRQSLQPLAAALPEHQPGASLNSSFSSQRSDSPARQRAMRELHVARRSASVGSSVDGRKEAVLFRGARRDEPAAPQHLDHTEITQRRSSSDTSFIARVFAPLARLVHAARNRALRHTSFATTLFGQIREAQEMIARARTGEDTLPFPLPSLLTQMHLWQTQLVTYIFRSDAAVPVLPFLLRRDRKTVRRSSARLPIDDALTVATAPPDSAAATGDDPAPPTRHPAVRTMLRRGEGLKRFYNRHPTKGDEHRQEGAQQPPPAHDAKVTGADRIAALAVPKHVSEPHEAAASRSASAGAGTRRPADPTTRHVAKRAASADRRPSPPQHAEPDAMPSHRAVSGGAADPPQGERTKVGAHHVQAPKKDTLLPPELTALLMPTTHRPWTVDECLVTSRTVLGTLPDAATARRVLEPFVQTGRDFNRLIENLTALL